VLAGNKIHTAHVRHSHHVICTLVASMSLIMPSVTISRIVYFWRSWLFVEEGSKHVLV
jgi:hypothetical protein